MTSIVEIIEIGIDALIVINSKSITFENCKKQPSIKYNAVQKKLLIVDSVRSNDPIEKCRVEMDQYSMLVKAIQVNKCGLLCLGKNFSSVVNKFDFALTVSNDSKIRIQDINFTKLTINSSGNSLVEFSRSICDELSLCSFGNARIEGLQIEKDCFIKSVEVSTNFVSICKHAKLNRTQEDLSVSVVTYHMCDKKKREMLDAIRNPVTAVPQDISQRRNKRPYPTGEDISKDGSDSCKICLVNKSRVAILPCGHQVLCFSCCESFYQMNSGKPSYRCPVCRDRVKELVKIFQ